MGGFELLFANRETQLRHPSRRPGSVAIVDQPQIVSFGGPDGTFCQMQLLGPPAGAARDELTARLSSLLESLAALGRHSGEVAPPAELDIDFHQIAVEFVRHAA